MIRYVVAGDREQQRLILCVGHALAHHHQVAADFVQRGGAPLDQQMVLSSLDRICSSLLDEARDDRVRFGQCRDLPAAEAGDARLVRDRFQRKG